MFVNVSLYEVYIVLYTYNKIPLFNYYNVSTQNSHIGVFPKFLCLRGINFIWVNKFDYFYSIQVRYSNSAETIDYSKLLETFVKI